MSKSKKGISQKDGEVVVIGGVSVFDYDKFRKEFPVEGMRFSKPATLIKYIAKRTGKTPGELLELWRDDPIEFRNICRAVYESDIRTARLINFSNRLFEIGEGIRRRLAEQQKEGGGYLPYSVKQLRPIKELDPSLADELREVEDALEKQLRKLLEGL